MVGIRLPDSGANWSSPFVAGDVVFRPREFTGTITDDWASVPWCTTDFAPYGDKTIDHLAAVHNPANGIGDICRYMGVVDGSRWRMATAAEWNELYRNGLQNGGESAVLPNDGSGWILGSFHPLSGRAFGPHQSRITIASNTQVDNADPYDAGAVFLPASGHRNFNDGVLTNIGSGSWLWSTTACTENNGYDMGFYSTTITPYWVSERTHALPIRCIRE